MKVLEKLIMELVSQLLAPTALPSILIVWEARIIRMECTPQHTIIKLRCSGFYKNEGNREINYGNCIAASRPDRITPGIIWIGGANDKNDEYPTTKLLPSLQWVSIKYERNQEINIWKLYHSFTPRPHYFRYTLEMMLE
jgi:hypothetical protein